MSASVWEHYEKLPDSMARCLLCRKEYSYKTSITNLKKHLHYKHKSVYRDVMTKNYKRKIVSSVNNGKINTKSRLPIWNYYDRLPDKTAKCNICRREYSYKTSITNLKKHLNYKHKSAYRAVVDPGSAEDRLLLVKEQVAEDLEDSFCEEETAQAVIHIVPPSPRIPLKFEDRTRNPSPRTPLKFEDRTHNQQQTSHEPRKTYQNPKELIDAKLLQIIIQDYQPFSVVESKAFRDFVHALNPSYEFPSRKLISRTLIPTQYLQCKRQMMELVQSAKNVCVTVDSWTSVLKEEFVAVTAHFFVDFELKSVLLHCEYITCSQTPDDLAEIFMTIASEWNIGDKITLAVSGKTENVNNAILKAGWPFFGCFLYKLNLVIEEAIEQISFILNKVKIIIDHFKKCNASTEELIKYQTDIENKTQALRLIQSDQTSWTSIFYMLERFLRLQGALEVVMQDLEVNLPNITIGMWDAIRQVCIILKPFEEVTRIMSGSRYLSASLAIVIVDGLKNAIAQMKSKFSFGVANEFIEKIEEGLNTYFPESEIEENSLLAICTFLDPRFKIHAFLDQNQGGAEEVVDKESSQRKIRAYSVKEHILELIKSKLREKQEKNNTPNVVVLPNKHQSDSSISTNGENIEFVTVQDIEFVSVWGKFDKTIEAITPSADDIATNAEKELNMFLNEEMLQRESSPLEWWKLHAFIYPNITEIFKEHCHIVVTSMECEYAYSKSGNIMTDKRSQLSRKHTSELVFLKSNLAYCK